MVEPTLTDHIPAAQVEQLEKELSALLPGTDAELAQYPYLMQLLAKYRAFLLSLTEHTEHTEHEN